MSAVDIALLIPLLGLIWIVGFAQGRLRKIEADLKRIKTHLDKLTILYNEMVDDHQELLEKFNALVESAKAECVYVEGHWEVKDKETE